MHILPNGSESNLQKTPLQYSSRGSRNPNLFEYMSFWARDKTAQIPLQSMQTWYFFPNDAFLLVKSVSCIGKMKYRQYSTKFIYLQSSQKEMQLSMLRFF